MTHASSLDGTGAAEVVRKAVEEAGFVTTAYARNVPSFGQVAYFLATVGAPAPWRLPQWAETLVP